MAHPIRIPNPNPNPNSNPSSSSIDPNSGFCSETKTYHSIRPHSLLPPETTSLSVTDFVFSLLLQNSPSSPETTAALIDAATRRRIPYPDVVTRTKTLAASLHHQIGLSNGHSAFVLSPNSVQIPILYLSLFSLGVTVSASNPTSSKSEICRQIDLSKPVIAFTISDTAHNLPSLLHRTIILDSPEFESMMTNRTRKFHRISVSQSDTAAILYSSGTTGKSKGVELSHRNFISSLAGSQASRPVRFSPAVSFCAVPYFHVYGFLLCLRAVAMGESLVCIGRFDVGMMIRAIDEFRVTQVALAPPVIVALVRKGDLMDGGHDLSSLEVVACGGAPLPNAVIERFKKRFPWVLVAQSYGLTESTGGVSRTMGPIESQILGPSGRLMPYCQAKIVDVETGISLPPFKHGDSNFDSLKSLSLQYENINAKHIESFLSSCPSLERLCLAKSAILSGLKISGSSLKLKYLEICCCFNLNWVKISAPNLVSFKYWGPEIALSLDNVPLLSEVSFLEAYCISLVKHRFKHFTCILSQLRSLSLTLNYPWLTEFPKLDGLRNLHTLELNLGVWDFDIPFQLCTSITTALPYLHKFSLRLYWFMNYESMDTWVPIIENDRHHSLKVVDLVGFVGCSLDVGIVRYLAENAVSLEKITIQPCKESWRNSHVDLMEVKEKEEARGRAHELRAILSAHTQLLVL